MQITVTRLLGIAGLGALAILIGLFSRWDDNPAQAAADVVSSYGLGILVPFAALWLGTSAIGDLVDDRLLVYLWLKPVARWQLPAAAVLATVSVVLPLTAVPLAASAFVAGAGDVAPAAFLAASLAAFAYAGLFVAAGIAFRRAVWWGLAFVLAVGERRRPHGRGRGPLHGQRLGRSVLGLAPDVGVSDKPGPQALRSSSSPRSPSQAGLSRRGATAAPTWTDVRASAAGRTPGTAPAPNVVISTIAPSSIRSTSNLNARNSESPGRRR